MLTITGFHAIEEKIKSLDKDAAKNAVLLYDKLGPRAKKIVENAKSSKIECRQVETALLNKAVSGLNEVARDHRGIVLQISGQEQTESNIIEFEKMAAHLEMRNVLRAKCGARADQAQSDVCTKAANGDVGGDSAQSGMPGNSAQNDGATNNMAKRSIVVVLDSITDPHNVGAIIRSADQFGSDLVIIPTHRSSTESEIIARASSGAASWVPLMFVSNLTNAIQVLKDNGYWIYGADAGGENLQGFVPSDKIAIIMGSEGSGMSRIVRQNCDKILSIPTCGKLDSLNVSVAAGILLYALSR